MGSKETRQMFKYACTGRLVIVALSAQPPGVNELCVCVCVQVCCGFYLYLQTGPSAEFGIPAPRGRLLSTAPMWFLFQ